MPCRCFKTPLFHYRQSLARPADTRAEVAFVGHSNAGKSSAINTPQPHPAGLCLETPAAPSINFDLGHERFLVDLPGCGYAEVPEAVRAHWVELQWAISGRAQLAINLLLIMDARHPLKDLDRRMLDYFTPTGPAGAYFIVQSRQTQPPEQPPPCARSRPNWPNTATPSACNCSPA